MKEFKSVSELYVEEIKKKLKENRAAVMVGAGFSRNADRIDKSSVHMLDWFELADVFCDTLGIPEGDDRCKKYLDPINLAQQVEELYGKTYLNELLRDVMEDDNYKPGNVHKLLVELPWTDIFTTNYDTLLERAYETSMKRRYRVVYRQNDLIHSAMEPRIVKLHGSFPSYEPFIISEEDYRRYPDDYAPFVNTVQQALLEKLFVLIGFSGSDPNFLKWIGWIHDNLGLNNAPRIYMIVHKTPSQVQIKMLNARNIDLIILNDIKAYNNDDYKESIRRFLVDLTRFCTDNGNGGKKSWPRFTHRSFDKTATETLNDLKYIHSSYPGWITARVSSLGVVGHLLIDAEMCISRIANSKSINPLELEICKEYCWFSEITGTIYSVHMLDNLDKIVSRHQNYFISDDYADSDANGETIVRNTLSGGQEGSTVCDCSEDERYTICYIEVCILHGCRVLGLKQWEGFYERVVTKIHKPDTWDDLYAFFCYETAMQSLYSLEWEELEKKIRRIPADNDHPEWLLRKASLLALLGCYEEVLEMLKGSIEDVRTILSRLDEEKGKEYNRFSSLESSMISLYSFTLQAHESKIGTRWAEKENNLGDSEEDSSKRRLLEEGLKNYRDDFIWNLENSKFASVFAGNYKPRTNVIQNMTFDIGVVNRSTQFGGNNESALAFQFVAFREVTGHPFRIGFVVDKEGLSGSISIIAWNSPRFALALALLEPDTKLIENIFTRLLISEIAVDVVDDCCLGLINLMRYGMKSISERMRLSLFDTQIQESALTVIPELLSRFVTRSSNSIKEQMIELLVEIYSCDALDQSIKVYHLTKRLIECCPKELLKEKIDCFWKIDIKQMDSYFNSNFHDPFYYLYCRLFSEDEKLVMNEEQVKKFNEILNKCTDNQYSKNAITRMCYINYLYTLPDNLRDRFNSAVWADDNLEGGLPDLGDFINVLAIDIPCEKPVEEVKTIFEHSLIDEYRRILQSKTITSYDFLLNKTLKLFERIDIDKEKAKKIISIGLGFCKLLSENQAPAITFGTIDIKGDLFRLDEIIGIALLKSGLATKDKSVKIKEVDEIIAILQDNRCPHPLLSWCVSEEDRYLEIKRCAFSVESGYSNSANRAMEQLIEQGIEIEDRIVSMMVDSISTTMSYTVNTYALGLENLVRKNLLEEKYCDQVAEALPRFDKITELGILDENDEVMRKIAMRKVISILAHTMYGWYSEREKAMPKGVQFWMDKSNDPDEFAEIRMVWM